MGIYSSQKVKNDTCRKHLKVKSITIYLKESLFDILLKECYNNDYGEILLEGQFEKTILIPKNKSGKGTVKLLLRNEETVGRAGNTKMHGCPTFKFDENDAFYIKKGKVIFDADNSKDLERKYSYEVKLIEMNHELFDNLFYSENSDTAEVFANSIYLLFNGIEEPKRKDYIDMMSDEEILKKAKQYKFIKTSVNQFYGGDEMKESLKRQIREKEAELKKQGGEIK